MTEREFSKRVRDCWRQLGGIAYSIETGATSIGIPDLLMLMPGKGMWWFELKVCHTQTIPWRAGQQRFAREYYLATDSTVKLIGMYGSAVYVLSCDKKYNLITNGIRFKSIRSALEWIMNLKS